MTDDERAMWIERRKRGIGGSDAAAIIGVSPWKTPIDLYLEKLGESEEQQDNEAMRWGRLLEPVLHQEIQRRLNVDVFPPQEIVDPDLKFLRANVDGLTRTAVVELKTTGWFNDEWGDEGTDEVPLHYLVQCFHYMNITGMERAHLGCLSLGQREFRIYNIAYNEKIGSELRKQEIEFWNNHVVPHVPPPPRDASDVVKLYRRQDDGSSIVADETAFEYWRCLHACKKEQKRVTALREALEDSLKAYMQGSANLIDAEGNTLATWRSSKVRRLDSGEMKQHDFETWMKYSVESDTRRFLLKEIKDGE